MRKISKLIAKPTQFMQDSKYQTLRSLAPIVSIVQASPPAKSASQAEPAILAKPAVQGDKSTGSKKTNKITSEKKPDKVELPGRYVVLKQLFDHVGAVATEKPRSAHGTSTIKLQGWSRTVETVINEDVLQRYVDGAGFFDDLRPLFTANASCPLTLALNMWFYEKSEYKEQALQKWRDLGSMDDMPSQGRLLFERARYASKIGIYDEQVLGDFRLGHSTSSKPRISDLMRWADHIWYSQGTDYAARDVFRLVEHRDLSPAHLMKLAAFYADAGEYEKAISFAKSARQKDKESWISNRYLGLTHLLYEQHLITSDWARDEYEMLERLRANDGTFEHFVKNRSFAVVGSSPNQIGSGAGPLIDKNKYVIRFNQARTDNKFNDDYGSKFNIWVKSQMNYHVKRRSYNPDIKLALMHDSGIFSSKNLYFKLKDMDSHYKLQLIPRTIMFDIISKIKRQPSLGLLIVYWCSIFRTIRNQRHVFGMSLNDQEHGKALHYYDLQYRGTGHRHDWEAERKLFDEIVRPAKKSNSG